MLHNLLLNTPREGDLYTGGLQRLGMSLVSLGLEKLQTYPCVWEVSDSVLWQGWQPVPPSGRSLLGQM